MTKENKKNLLSAEELVAIGVDALEKHYGRSVLPYNVISYRQPKEEFARFGGWLKAAATLPALRRLILRTQSPNGVYSPHTTVPLWKLSKKFYSPGGLERKLRAVKRRAQAIIATYDEGTQPSWAGIAHGLMTAEKLEKAAIIAAASSLSESWEPFASYREAKKWLVKLHSCSDTDHENGLRKIKPTPLLEKRNIRVYLVAFKKKCGWVLCHKVTHKTLPLYGNWSHNIAPEEAILKEVSSWRVKKRIRTIQARAKKILTNKYLSFISKDEEIVVSEDIAYTSHYKSGENEEAAIIAVTSFLREGLYTSPSESSEWLVKLHSCSEIDHSDGVESRLDPKPLLKKCGIAVYRIAVKDESSSKWSFRHLVKQESTGRTYHCDAPYKRQGIKAAMRAWREQDRLAAEEANLVGFLNGELGFSPLLVREDSYSAGNCKIGTERWIQEQGWDNRRWIPGTWLIPHLEEEFPRNVATGLYLRCTDSEAA